MVVLMEGGFCYVTKRSKFCGCFSCSRFFARLFFFWLGLVGFPSFFSAPMRALSLTLCLALSVSLLPSFFVLL